MEAIKTSVTNSPAESEVKGKAVKKSGKRIGYNYIILKSLKESQKNDVVKCLYIKSLTNFGICVIKEGTYGDSKDKQGRDIKDRLMWQRELHEKLQDKVRLPRLLGSFEENGNYYLVLERIKGKSLYKACKDAGKDLREGLITGNKLGMKFLGYMIQMIELLETLHKHGIVHRDVTAANFMITPTGKVAIIDFELSYSLNACFPAPPFQLGTYGYMSPEQERTDSPAVNQDVFSVGAILLQMWTNIWPTKLTNGSIGEMDNRIRFFIPDNEFAAIVASCLNVTSDKRPDLSEVRKVIKRYVDGIRNKLSRAKSTVAKFSKEEIFNTIQSTVTSLGTPLFADEDRGWFSENVRMPQNIDKRKINKAWYTSFQQGASGVIYLLSKANMLGFNIDTNRPFITKGIELVQERYMDRIERTNAGLYYGSSGIAVVLATSMREGLIERKPEYYEWINRLLKKDSNVFGIQHGLAGQGIANWLCHPFSCPESMEKRLNGYADLLLGVQERDGSWRRFSNKGKNRATKGFAHGVAGIIYFLLEYAGKTKNAEILQAAVGGLDWLIKNAIRENGIIKWRSSLNKEIALGWCEGTAGIALTFLKAYSITGEVKYKHYAIGALNSHDKYEISNHLCQCHGLSGLGEIYLEMFRILNDEEWLKKANWILQVLMHLRKHHDNYGTFWLVEHERQPVADFMTGNSGIVHYLLRYCFPEKIKFPLLS